jgi:methyl coenzyme M reductase alpha subunit
MKRKNWSIFYSFGIKNITFLKYSLVFKYLFKEPLLGRFPPLLVSSLASGRSVVVAAAAATAAAAAVVAGGGGGSGWGIRTHTHTRARARGGSGF